MEFIIITGMSGGGKSQAANVLEDAGYYCIDNMPAKLIPEFAELYKNAERERDVAFIIDVRGENEFDNMFNGMSILKDAGYNCRMIFIECSDEVLFNRYKETRRVHPLEKDNNMSINLAISSERRMLEPVKQRADIVIDTSKTTLNQLRERIYAAIKSKDDKRIYICCTSFGFKYGPVAEADLVFDVRCFKNPFYVESLKHQTGLDLDVRDFVFSGEETKQFFKKLCDMVEFLLPLYVNEGKHQLTVAVGCTGGKHRSVAIAQALSDELEGLGYASVAFHRDISKQ